MTPSALAQQLRRDGRKGDSILAHINPREAAMLLRSGGSGTRNPKDGLPEFFNPSGPGSGTTYSGDDTSGGQTSGGSGPIGASSNGYGNGGTSYSNGWSPMSSSQNMGFASPQETGNYAQTGQNFAPANSGLVGDTGLTGRQYGIINAEQSLNPTMPSQGIAAMLGNMNYESGARVGDLNPNAVNSIGAFGIAQDYAPSRQANMLRSLGIPENTPISQLGANPASKGYGQETGALAGTMNGQLAANNAEMMQSYPGLAAQLQNPKSTLEQNVNAFGNGFEVPGTDAQGNVLGYAGRVAAAKNWSNAISAAGPYSKADVRTATSSDPFTSAVYSAVGKQTTQSVNGMPGGLSYGDSTSPAYMTQPAGTTDAQLATQMGAGVTPQQPSAGSQGTDAHDIAVALGKEPADNNIGAGATLTDAELAAQTAGSSAYAPTQQQSLPAFAAQAISSPMAAKSVFAGKSLALGSPSASAPMHPYDSPSSSDQGVHAPSYGTFDTAGNRLSTTDILGSSAAQPAPPSAAAATSTPAPASAPAPSAAAADSSPSYLSTALHAPGAALAALASGAKSISPAVSLAAALSGLKNIKGGTYAPASSGGYGSNKMTPAQVAQAMTSSAGAAEPDPYQLNPDGSIPISWPLSKLTAYYNSRNGLT